MVNTKIRLIIFFAAKDGEALTVGKNNIKMWLWLTSWTPYAQMGTIKDRNGMDLIEADDIKKKWQEYTEELYKKDLPDPDNDDGVITHLEPDILEFEVKWALGSITTELVEVMEFQLSYFRSQTMIC